MRLLRGAAVLVAAVCAGCSAIERVSMSTCEDTSAPQLAIPACGRLLEQGGLDRSRRAHVLFNRGEAYAMSGRLDEARADLDEAVALQPRKAKAHAARGAVLFGLGRLDEAMADLDRAVELDPNDFRALTNRASLLDKQGQYARSLEDFDRAIALAPEEAIPLDGRCWVRAVVGEDLPGAVDDCTRAIELQNFPNSHNSRGFAYFRMRRHAEAVVDYDRAIAGDPNVASSYYMRGLARRALGDEAAARADIAKGVALEPGIATRYAGYGIAAE